MTKIDNILSPSMQIALAIYVNVMCDTLSLAECEHMQDQINKGIRPDTFKGMGLENLPLVDCKELIRIVINSKKRKSERKNMDIHEIIKKEQEEQ